MHKTPLLFVISLALMLTGCAEKWEKFGATEQEFEAMKAACISRASARFPPMMRQVQLTNGYTTPVITNCNGFGYSVSCFSSGGQYVPPTYIAIDDNTGARDQDTRSCFYENGWHPVKDHSDQEASISASDIGQKPTFEASGDYSDCVKRCHFSSGGYSGYSCEDTCKK